MSWAISPTISEILLRKLHKSSFLPIPVSFKGVARTDPWNCCIKFGTKNLKSLGYPKVKTLFSYVQMPRNWYRKGPEIANFTY